ncbi:probable cytochrome P450 6a13 [Solenopsis invicta]|uniref:probable cytochrome P450 6a13 n=1 Tax=Solenopsis invicta TaxID=13686 RepID=UPI00193DD8E6|nr:probable cytochrome P450 6a13 [Solenopsis invicta]
MSLMISVKATLIYPPKHQFLFEKRNMIILVSLIFGALVALYFYLTRNHKYWQTLGVPCMDGALPGFGHMLSVATMRTGISDFCDKIYKDNKGHSMIGVYDFMSPLLMILEPKLVKTVLKTNFSSFSENAVHLDSKLDPLLSYNIFGLSGEKWVNGRKRLTYAFSSMRLKILLESVKKVCVTFEDYIDKKLSNVEKAEFELKTLFSRYTAQVVAAAGFGVDGYCFDDEKEDISFRKIGQSILEPTARNAMIFTIVFLIPSLNRILKMKFIPDHVDHFFRTLVADHMEQRRKDKIPRHDFLHLMAELERAEGGKFDNEMLAGQAMSFILDGYETSSSTMSYVGFHLASYPEIQEKLREEVMSVLNRYNGEITYEGLKEMTYMDQVFNESMRMIPAAVVMKKRCTKEFELKGSDGVACRVPPGMEILIPVQALHKDPQYWEHPEEYDPERFNPDRKHSIEKFAYLPFGEGPRICVGMRMAQLLMKAGFTVILRKYKLELSPKMQVPLKMIPGALLPAPKGGFSIYFRQL